MVHVIIRILNDPDLALIGAAAVRRGNDLLIALSAALTPLERRQAAYDLMTDDEFTALFAQVQQERVTPFGAPNGTCLI